MDAVRPRHADSIHFAGLLREGLAQHLAGTLLAAHALTSRMRKENSGAITEASQLVELLQAASDDLSELITRLQTQHAPTPPEGIEAFKKEFGKIIHDNIAQEAASSILMAGLLAQNLEKDGSRRRDDAKQLQATLDKLTRGVSVAMRRLN